MCLRSRHRYTAERDTRALAFFPQLQEISLTGLAAYTHACARANVKSKISPSTTRRRIADSDFGFPRSRQTTRSVIILLFPYPEITWWSYKGPFSKLLIFQVFPMLSSTSVRAIGAVAPLKNRERRRNSGISLFAVMHRADNRGVLIS